MRKVMIAVVGAFVLLATIALGVKLYVEHKMGRPNVAAAKADAQARIASLVHGDIAEVVEGLPPVPRAHQKVVLGEVHDALARLGPFGGATLSSFRAETSNQTGVVDLTLAYRLRFPQTDSCDARFSYEVKRGIPPLLVGLFVDGDCIRGLTQAEAHGLAP